MDSMFTSSNLQPHHLKLLSSSADGSALGRRVKARDGVAREAGSWRHGELALGDDAHLVRIHLVLHHRDHLQHTELTLPPGGREVGIKRPER
jgi:hypothetical protein